MFGFKTRKENLTHADVVWCFANIVGRHPHSAAEINHFQESCTDFRDLVRKLIATPEFVTRRTTATDGFLYDDSDRVQHTVLAILKRLEPMRAVERQKIRIGKECDGGYVMLDDFDGITAAYSVGICDEVSWDLYMAERGIEVFQYDHTIDGLPLQHARFHWSKKGLGASVTADLETLPRLVEMNGHRGRSDLLLKCDIEGCEWKVLAALPSDCLRQFKQIVLEIHYLERLTEPDFAKLVERAVAVLTADHQAAELAERGLGAQVGKVTQPKVFDAFERLPARTCQLPMLGFTHRVDRLVEINAEVKLVMHDVHLRQEVPHGVAIGAPESIATALTPARCAASSSCRSNPHLFFLASFHWIPDLTTVEIIEHGGANMPSPENLLTRLRHALTGRLLQSISALLWFVQPNVLDRLALAPPSSSR